MGSINLLSFRLISSRLTKFPSVEGIDPVNMLCPTLSSFRRVREPRVEGMEPVKEL